MFHLLFPAPNARKRPGLSPRPPSASGANATRAHCKPHTQTPSGAPAGCSDRPRRWRANTLGEIQAEWGLTEGEARGVLYAQASQTTIDKILEHPRGGFGLGLEILALKCATSLEGFIENQAQEARRAAAHFEAEERRWAALRGRVSERSSFDRNGADAGRNDRRSPPGLG
jgi:hypothetical protein